MPQIKLEYTDNIPDKINFEDTFSKIHHLLHDIAGIAIHNCKSRAVKLDKYYIGDGISKSKFVHLEIALLEGRTKEIKQRIAEEILQILKKNYLTKRLIDDLQVTVEIKDIKKEFYFKYPEGTFSKI